MPKWSQDHEELLVSPQFLENLLPALAGEHYFANRPKQFLFKILFFGSWTLPFVTAKRILALSIFNTKPQLKIKMGDMLGSVCHTVFYRVHFRFHLHISAMLLSSFCWKSWLRLPLSHCTNTWGSHCLQDMSYTCHHARPRWEAWFWKWHISKNMKHLPLGPSKCPNLLPFCTIYCSLKAAFRLHATFRRSETLCRAWIEGRRCALPRGPSTVEKRRCLEQAV